MRPLLKEIWRAAFAVPGAITILAKLELDLDYGKVLQAVILKFDRASELLWSGLLKWLPALKQIDHVFLSWVAIIVATALWPIVLRIAEPSATSKTSDGGTRHQYFWIGTSTLFALGFLVIFDLLPLVTNSLDLLAFLLLVIVTFALVPVSWMLTSGKSGNEHPIGEFIYSKFIKIPKKIAAYFFLLLFLDIFVQGYMMIFGWATSGAMLTAPTLADTSSVTFWIYVLLSNITIILLGFIILNQPRSLAQIGFVVVGTIFLDRMDRLAISALQALS